MDRYQPRHLAASPAREKSRNGLHGKSTAALKIGDLLIRHHAAGSSSRLIGLTIPGPALAAQPPRYQPGRKSKNRKAFSRKSRTQRK
jgi:hypothetical protein